MSRESVVVKKEGSKIIITVHKTVDRKTKHIGITMPAHISLATICESLNELPEHLKRGN